jgi:hypothetical protein
MKMPNTSPDTITSPVKAIRAKCLDCSGDSAKEVKLCTVETCPLHPFRFGKNPFHKGRKLTEQEKRERVERLAKWREEQKLEA